MHVNYSIMLFFIFILRLVITILLPKRRLLSMGPSDMKKISLLPPCYSNDKMKTIKHVTAKFSLCCCLSSSLYILLDFRAEGIYEMAAAMLKVNMVPQASSLQVTPIIRKDTYV